ncbi:hypothetical protein C8R48DRAFT_676637 [Suillus tomentosus]|nr:hypothetical protein C8R48DRAFT_676637 [Suillus tomentosus]
MLSDSESLSLSPPRKHKKSSYSNGSSSSSELRKHKKSANSGSSSQSSKHKNSTHELLQAVQTKHSKKLKKSDDEKSILDPIEMTKDIIEHHLHLYNGILEFVPSLHMELDTISTDKLSKIISVITKGMSDAQSTAFSSVKHKGLNNPEEGMEKLQSGKIKMAATSKTASASLAMNHSLHRPTGFYEDSVYDSQDKTKDLFRNHVVAWTYFTLSNAQNWTNEIRTMNLEVLFWAIIDMLNDDKDSWIEDTLSWWNVHMESAAQAKFIKKPSNSEDDSDQENDIADIKAQCLARRGAVPPQRKAHNEAKQPAAAALFDDDKPEYPSFKKTPTAPLPQPVKLRPRPQPQPVFKSPVTRTLYLWPLIEQSDDNEHSPPLPAKKKLIVESTKCRQLPESDEDSVEYRALSPSTPPAKKTQPHTRITKRPQPILTDDEEHPPLSESFLPPAKKIQSDSPLPPLTKDEDDKPSPLSPPPPMKPANQVVPCPAVLTSLQPAATKAQVNLKLKLALANWLSIEDKDITFDTPAVPKKKRKKTSPTKATKQNLLAQETDKRLLGIGLHGLALYYLARVTITASLIQSARPTATSYGLVRPVKAQAVLLMEKQTCRNLDNLNFTASPWAQYSAAHYHNSEFVVIQVQNQLYRLPIDLLK